MATQDDVRRIASALPGATEGEGRFGFSVVNNGRAKGFLWSWAERVHPKKARVINDSVLAVRVTNMSAKSSILASNPSVYFTEPHYDGFPAVLVRLDAVDLAELEDLILEAWRTQAPRQLARELNS